MTDTITQERLNKIEARANAATPGPWEVRWNKSYIGEKEITLNLFLKLNLVPDGCQTGENETAFIAESRTDVLAMVAELRRCLATQWVTYDGTLETLPEEGEYILLYSPAHKRSLPGGFWGGKFHQTLYEPIPVNIGDRWAYLPKPPEAVLE